MSTFLGKEHGQQISQNMEHFSNLERHLYLKNHIRKEITAELILRDAFYPFTSEYIACFQYS